ncbi:MULTISPECIES: STM4015 family protein [Thermomonospora]|uniref:Leucine-rich repeat domain-containing protein n=1 Tax=Thermomonospora cellulosilytica TaxID=1411118 RepID=A0A7W3R8J8_9ACTN|nr:MULTISPECIES: STM4015 family protein [Thermomonospora]MBA9004408.1 hypothetical protein [Thermomonospora cellulosilytica]
MTIGQHLTEYAGLPVADFALGTARDELPDDPASVAWRISSTHQGGGFAEVLESFLETVDTGAVTALVVGYWYPEEPVELLVAAAGRLPALRSLFVGDIVVEESEISWIEHSDISPLLAAYPRLERFGVRGAQGLELKPFRSEHLRELRFESGGLPGHIVRAVAASDLPALESLTLWLGEENYGGDATVADLAPILSGERLPALRHLGLQDSEIQDEICAAVASAPIVARLESLALSMGVLTDRGAEALLSGQPLTHLRSLDLHHHFMSDAMAERIRKALPGVEVDLSGRREPDVYDGDVWMYVAVSE